jgi:hypothetical protein
MAVRGRRMLPRFRSAWALTLFLPAVAVAEEPRELAPVPARPLWSADVSLTQEYRYRSAGSADAVATGPLEGGPAPRPKSDHDLRLTLDGTVTGLNDRVLGTVSAALWRDLDSHVPQGDADLFGDSQDLAQPLFVLYTLTAELRRTSPIDRLALGRQQSTHGLPVTFDGGALDLRFLERRLSFFTYGGRTVHFFETVPGLLENWLFGGGAGFRITPHTQVELDSRYLHETLPDARGVLGKRVDTNTYGLTLAGRWDDVSGKLFTRGMNRSLSHVGGVFHMQVPSVTMGVDGQATAQLVPLGEIAESESPYYAMMGNSRPHVRARLETWKDFVLGKRGTLALAVGGRARQLLRDDPSRFNRNTNLVYARLDLKDLPWTGAFVSATAEWNLPTYDDSSFFSVGGSAGYLSPRNRFEAGTYYQRFKINYYRDVEELTAARTVYAMASWRVLPRLEVRGRYVLEIVDRAIHAAYLTLREDF